MLSHILFFFLLIVSSDWSQQEAQLPSLKLLIVGWNGGLCEAESNKLAPLLLAHLPQDLPEPLDLFALNAIPFRVFGVPPEELHIDGLLSVDPLL